MARPTEPEVINVRVIAVGLSLISAFFVFYTTRLLVVTGFLRHTRAGGQGAYIGAIVFPLIALACAWGARRAWRRGGRTARPAG